MVERACRELHSAGMREAALIVERTIPPMKFGLKGSADILGIWQDPRANAHDEKGVWLGPVGRFLGIECKTVRGRQSPEQLAFEAMVKRMGGVYILARSVEDVTRVIGAVP